MKTVKLPAGSPGFKNFTRIGRRGQGKVKTSIRLDLEVEVGEFPVHR